MDTSVFTYGDFLLDSKRSTVIFNFISSHGGEDFPFSESFTFPAPLTDTFETYRLLRALHLACGISYYKIFVNQEIEHPYAMSTREAEFWNTVFRHGLGEFLYVNKLDPNLLATFGPQEGRDAKVPTRSQLESKALLGIGGGKDSIVAGELLKAIGIDVTGFVMATGTASGQTESVAKTMKVSLSKVQRTLDKSLLEVQERPGAYKGHIPISLLFALTGSLLAISQKKSYVIVANEASASIPRAAWAGEDVNHQWSKSFGFEQLLQSYIRDFVSTELHYFSAIRPLSSVAVAKLFTFYPQYFEVFTSDNYSFRVRAEDRPNDRWSLESAKSLSSFILMSAWLNQDQLLQVFGRNFFDEPSLEPLFLRLTGIEGEPPLDCVGTPGELRASLGQAFSHQTFASSLLMQTALKYGIVATDRVIAPGVETFLHLQPEEAFPDVLKNKLITKITEGIS